MKDVTFPKWPLFASLLAFFVLTAALVARVQLGASPDEAAHWVYVEHLAQTARLPVFQGLTPPSPDFQGTLTLPPGYEFHQPPLYYLLCAPLWKMSPAGVQNYTCRGVSLLCGLAMVWVVWATARLLFPLRPPIAALSAAFIALLPLHQAISAGSNNDSLGGLVCGVLFYLVARFTLDGVTWRDIWQLGFVAGLGILSKNTTLSVAFLSFAALFLEARREETSEAAPRPVLALGAAILMAMLLGGPILLRNQLLYGDPLAQGVFNQTFSLTSLGPAQLALVGIDALDYMRGLMIVAFYTLWGFFGGPNRVVTVTHPLTRHPQFFPLLLPVKAAYVPYVVAAQRVLVPLCAVAPVLSVLGWRRGLELDAAQKRVFGYWLTGVALVLLAWASFAARYFAGAQARYGNAALLPLCIMGAAGWVAFWGEGRALKIASAVFGLVLLTLTLLNVFGWKTLV